MFIRQVTSVNYRSVTVTFVPTTSSSFFWWTETQRYQLQDIRNASPDELREMLPSIIKKALKAGGLKADYTYRCFLYDARFDKADTYWEIQKLVVKTEMNALTEELQAVMFDPSNTGNQEGILVI